MLHRSRYPNVNCYLAIHAAWTALTRNVSRYKCITKLVIRSYLQEKVQVTNVSKFTPLKTTTTKKTMNNKIYQASTKNKNQTLMTSMYLCSLDNIAGLVTVFILYLHVHSFWYLILFPTVNHAATFFVGATFTVALLTLILPKASKILLLVKPLNSLVMCVSLRTSVHCPDQEMRTLCGPKGGHAEYYKAVQVHRWPPHCSITRNAWYR